MLSFLLGKTLLANSSYIPKAENLEKMSYEFFLDTHIYKSRTRIDDFGEKKDFMNGEGYSQNELELSGSYGWTQEVEITGGIRYRMNSSDLMNGGSLTPMKNSGVESYFFQINYMFPPKSRFLSNIMIRYRQVAYTNPIFQASRPTDHLVLGHGQKELQVGYLFYYPLKTSSHGIEGSLHYYSPGDLSNGLQYSLKGVYYKNKLAFYGGVEGNYSLKSSEFTDDPTQKSLSHTGASYLYNSVNQERLSLILGANYRINQSWYLGLGYIHDLKGHSTDIGSALFFNLRYRVSSYYSEQREKKRFKGYNIEAVIERSSSRGNYVVINKGFTNGIQKKMIFDFYAYDFKGGNKLLARGAVVRTRSQASIIRIIKWFGKRQSLDDGVVARGKLE